MQRRLRCLARDRPSRYGVRGAFFFGALRGTGPRATGAGGCVFFVVRGPVRRYRFLILAILQILAILLQTRAIKVLTDLFSLLRRRFYRH